MTDLTRPKRVHRDPYGGYLQKLIAGSNAKLGLTPQSLPDPAPYEPDEIEKALYRATLDFIKDRFGVEHAVAAVRDAGIESGEATDDDLDIDLYEDALDYVKMTFGEAAEKAILAELEQKP